MSKSLRYAKLILDAWPHIRDVVASLRHKALPQDAAITAGIAALAMIIDELDATESGKKVSDEALERIRQITGKLEENDAEADHRLAEKFAKDDRDG